MQNIPRKLISQYSYHIICVFRSLIRSALYVSVCSIDYAGEVSVNSHPPKSMVQIMITLVIIIVSILVFDVYNNKMI